MDWRREGFGERSGEREGRVIESAGCHDRGGEVANSVLRPRWVESQSQVVLDLLGDFHLDGCCRSTCQRAPPEAAVVVST